MDSIFWSILFNYKTVAQFATYKTYNKKSITTFSLKYLWRHRTYIKLWCGSQPSAGSVRCGCNGKIHTDYWVPWRKRDGSATLSRGDHPNPCLHRLFFLLFCAHYIEDGPHLLCTGSLKWLPLTENKDRMLLITSKKKDICKCKGKSGWTGSTHPWKV